MGGTHGGLDLWKLLLQANPMSKFVFALLVFCSVLSIAVLIERWIVYRRIQRSTETSMEMLDNWAMTQQWETAREEIGQAQRAKTPLFSVLRAGLATWNELLSTGETNQEIMDGMMREAVVRELKLVRGMMRANLGILANIASTAPFIGLFGTVVGIILTFDAISRTGNMGQELVASGIADALVATAMGLFAAIPALLAYNSFVNQLSQLLLTMESAAMQRIYFLAQRSMPVTTEEEQLSCTARQ